MKINTTKLVVGVLAVAGVASLVGSISGTVAWFQYNTRAVAEFTGTTAQCTEFLQVRTVKAASGDDAAYKGAADPTDLSSYSIGDKIILDGGTVKQIESDGGTGKQLTAGTAAATGAKYKVNGKVYKWTGTAWEEITAEYGDWGIKVDNAAILEAAGRSGNGLSPVTMPFVSTIDSPDQAAGTLYGQPVCGYETYATGGDYHWQEAETSDYMSFSLQFRVLNVNGGEATPTALYAQDLFLTDLTIAEKAVSGKKDISSAVRVHISNGTNNYLLAYGDGSGTTITTATTGKLDLNLNGEVDNTLDVPGSHYSWNTTTPSDLEYGKDLPKQIAYDAKNASNGFYPTNDKKGHLEGDKPLATTNSTVPTKDSDYTTISFKIWLEGWQALSEKNSADTDTEAHPTIWDSASYIGSEFNIGMSFGVTTLD